jgi:hypothetical protein
VILQNISKRILYTREDGGVSYHCPHAAAFFWAQRGGLWGKRPRGFFDEQVRRQVIGGVPEHAAVAWVKAMQYGGKTEAETWAIVRDRNCINPSGTAHELIKFADLPDSWFRDAWRRSHNGGPVYVDLERARDVQFKKIKTAEHFEMQRRANDLNLWNRPLALDMPKIDSAIRRARDPDELRHVWPDELRSHLQ